MDKLHDAIITACLTLGGGVLLLVITQIITRFIVEPLVEFRRLLGEIAYTLILNAKWLCNPSSTGLRPEFQEAKDECRKSASRLHAFSAAVPLYGFLADLGVVPELTKVYEAARQLIELSNIDSKTPVRDVDQQYKKISELLRIRVD